MILNPTTTSIDMIEFCININPHEFQKDIATIIAYWELDPQLEYWDSFKWDRYRHNWLYKNDDYSFYFGYKSNIGTTEANNKFRLKYNPNKVSPDDNKLKALLNIFKYRKGTPYITWVDIAFDYQGLTTSDLILDKGKKSEWKIHNYANKSDLTYYIGKSGTNGSVKVYDKAFEETKGLATYNKTRYEVTIKDTIEFRDINQWQCKADIPEMYLRGIQGLYNGDGLSPTEKLLIYAIETDYPMDKLTYEQRRRYREIASSRKEIYTKIAPSQPQIEKALQDFVNNLLN